MIYLGILFGGVLAGGVSAVMFVFEKKNLLARPIIMLTSLIRYAILALFLWILSGYGVTFGILWMISLISSFWIVILMWPVDYGN